MGAYKFIRQSFRQSMAERPEFLRARQRSWGKQKVIARAANPSNPPRARSLGYKASKDFIIVRVRVKRGNRVRPAPRMGRKPGKNVKRVSPGFPLSRIAEMRAAKTHKNMRVVGSYLAGKGGVNAYYEVVMTLRS